MSTIEQQVMKSVAMIYFARKVFAPRALKFYVLMVSAAGIAVFVSLSDVAANFAGAASNGPRGMSAFVFSALFSTELIVQAALLLGVLAALSLLFDFFRTVARERRFSL